MKILFISFLFLITTSCSKQDKSFWGTWRRISSNECFYPNVLSERKFFPNGQYEHLAEPTSYTDDSDSFENAGLKLSGTWTSSHSGDQLTVKGRYSVLWRSGKLEELESGSTENYEEITYKVENGDSPDVMYLTAIKERNYDKKSDTFITKKETDKSKRCKLERVAIFEKS